MAIQRPGIAQADQHDPVSAGHERRGDIQDLVAFAGKPAGFDQATQRCVTVGIDGACRIRLLVIRHDRENQDLHRPRRGLRDKLDIHEYTTSINPDR